MSTSVLSIIDSNNQNNLKKGSSTTPTRNKFIIPDSPLLPTPLPNWSIALAEFASTAPAQPNPQGRYHPGYWFPEATMFVSPANEATRAAFFVCWLHLRDIMLYRLHRPDLSTPLNPAQWRTILCLPIIKRNGREEGQTGSGRLRSPDMCYTILERFATEGGQTLDMEKIRGFSLNGVAGHSRLIVHLHRT
jgi:hypothetical protein